MSQFEPISPPRANEATPKGPVKSENRAGERHAASGPFSSVRLCILIGRRAFPTLVGQALAPTTAAALAERSGGASRILTILVSLAVSHLTLILMLAVRPNGYCVLKIFGGKYPAGSGVVERRHQFRRRGRLHSGRLIVLPILDIYRRYYEIKMSLFILATFYVSMSLGALAIEFAFQARGVVATHQAQVVEASLQLNYTTILNVLLPWVS